MSGLYTGASGLWGGQVGLKYGNGLSTGSGFSADSGGVSPNPPIPPSDLLGNEWQGMSLDFLTNTYQVRIATGSEQLTGTGPYTVEVSIGMDFTQNNYTMVV